MKYSNGIASALILAIALVLSGTRATSQLKVRVKPQHEGKHSIVHHPGTQHNNRVFFRTMAPVIPESREHRGHPRKTEITVVHEPSKPVKK